MAVTITNARWPAQRTARVGPYRDSDGHLWVVAQNSGTVRLSIFESTDDGVTWTAHDSGVQRSLNDSVFDSANGVIYVLANDTISDYYVYSYTIATNTWAEVYSSGTRPAFGEDVNGNTPAFLTRRSNGDFIVFYQGPVRSIEGDPVVTDADPDGVVGLADNWTKSAGTAATCLDDAVRDPTNARSSGDGNYISSSTSGQVSEVSLEAAGTYDAGETVTLKIYGSGGTKRRVDVTISVDGGSNWGTPHTAVIPAAGAAQWRTLDISSEITQQSHLDNLVVRLTCTSTGGGGFTAAQVDALYVEHSYTPAVDYRSVYYAKLTAAGAWGTPVCLNGVSDTTHYDVKSAVLGASDRAHFFFGSSTNLYHRSLSSVDALDSAASVGAAAEGSFYNAFYNGTLAKVVAGPLDDDTLYRATSQADPSWTADANAVGSDDESVCAAAFCYDGTSLYVFYRDAGSDDLYLNWTATTTWGVSVQHTSTTLVGVSVGLDPTADGVVFADSTTVYFARHAFVYPEDDGVVSFSDAIGRGVMRAAEDDGIVSFSDAIMLVPVLRQEAARFYANGTEAGSTPLAAQDADYTADLSGGDFLMQVRFRIKEVSGDGAATDDFYVVYSYNGNTWMFVGGAPYVSNYNSAYLTNGEATTERLTGGSGTWTSGNVSEDGLANDIQLHAGDYTEVLFSLKINAVFVADGDTLDFRVRRNYPFDPGDLGTYSVTPRITVSIPTGPKHEYAYPEDDGVSSFSDSITKHVSYAVADTGADFATPDAIQATRLLSRGVEDTGYSYGETLGRQLAVERQPEADTGVAPDDSISRTLAVSRSPADDTAVSHDDTLAVSKSKLVEVADTGFSTALGDEPTRVVAYQREPAADIGVSPDDLAARTLAAQRAPSPDTAVTPDDSIQVSKSKLVQVADTGVSTVLGDEAARAVGFQRSLDDSAVTPDDGISVGCLYLRPVTDTGQEAVTDTLVAGRAYERDLDDGAVTPDDAAACQLVALRVFADTGQSPDDSLARTLGVARDTADTGCVWAADTIDAEKVGGAKHEYAYPEDGSVVTDGGVARVALVQRGPLDTGQSPDDTLTASKSSARAFADTAYDYGETVVRALVVGRALADQGATHDDSLATSVGRAFTDDGYTHDDTVTRPLVVRVFTDDGVVFAEEVTLPQRAQPIADIAVGTWTAEPLYEKVDEHDEPNDTDLITSGTGDDDLAELRLRELEDPGGSTGHQLRYRIRATQSPTGLKVDLVQGTTVIASWTHSPVPTEFTTYEQTLSAEEADSITDYTDLRVRLTANV